MKVTGIVIGALAALATAAPTQNLKARKSFDLSSLNNLQKYNSQNLQYINNVNNLDLNLLEELGSVNNYNILSFSGLFSDDSFDLVALMQLQQLQVLLQFASLGLFNGYDLSSLSLSSLDLGLIENVGSVDLTQFIESSNVAQIQEIAGATVVVSKD